MQTLKKLVTSGLIALLLLTPQIALGQQIPAGYALVPLGSLGAGGYPAAATPQQFAPTGWSGYGYSQPATVWGTPPVSPAAASSTLRANTDLAFTGETVRLTATLRDASNLPLAGRTVALTSSRSSDQITATGATTNNNGEAYFLVTGREEGVTTLTALDTATGTVVAERVRVVFLQNKKSARGGSLKADVLSSATAVATGNQTAPGTADPAAAAAAASAAADSTLYSQKLVIDFPDKVPANTPNDVKINVLNIATGLPVETFTGAVNFTATDKLAILPQNYTFTQFDRGSHTFARAVTFGTPGQILLMVSGDQLTQPAQKIVEVVGEGATTDKPTLTSPTAGDIKNTLPKVTGSSKANSNLSLVVDDQAASSGQTDGSGAFALDLPTGLKDGVHKIQVALLAADGAVATISDAVNFTFDTVAPKFTNFQLLPGATVEIGKIVTVSLKSEPGLGSAAVQLESATLNLTEDAKTPGLYTGQVETTAAGDYALTVQLADRAGNQTTEPLTTPKLVVEAPLTIFNVAARPRNGRVDLTWDAPANAASVANYKIRYGPLESNLDKEYVTPDNGLSWHVEGLQNDTKYFFKVESLDRSGVKNGRSNTVAATPTALTNPAVTICETEAHLKWKPAPNPAVVRYEVAYGVQSGKYTEKQFAGRQTEATLIDLIPGTTYYFAVRGLDAANQPVYTPTDEAVATAGGHDCVASSGETPLQLQLVNDAAGLTYLSWNAIPGATGYRVYAGTQPGYFDLPTVEVSDTFYYPPAENGPVAQRYFAVRALTGGHEAANFSNVVQVQVGPAEVLAFSLLAGLAGAWWLRWRKQLAI